MGMAMRVTMAMVVIVGMRVRHRGPEPISGQKANENKTPPGAKLSIYVIL